MIDRRALISTGVAGLFAATITSASADPAAPNDPVAILTAIYTRAAKGKGDGGGAFVIENKAAKAKYLSKSLIELWERADAHTPKGDVGLVNFDPVTNSQEPDVRTFKVAAEKLEADKATVAVTITGHRVRKMILCARAPAGRSTTSGIWTMASPGRSVPCWKIP
jgi:hypothetical protein